MAPKVSAQSLRRFGRERRTRCDDLWCFAILERYLADYTNARLDSPISVHPEVPRLLERGRTSRKSVIKISNDLVVPFVKIDDRRGIGNLGQLPVGLQVIGI